MRPWHIILILFCIFSGRANADMVPILDASGNEVYWQGPEEIFRTYDLKVRVPKGQAVIVSSRTNYPQSLVPADLFFERNGEIVMAVKMGDGRIIHYPEIMSSFFLEQEGLAARYVDGSYIPVQARRGNALPERATINWRENPTADEGRYTITIEIPRQAFQEGGKYKVIWGTAPCGNSPGEAEFDLDILSTPWGPGGPGYIPPTGSSVTGVPVYYGGICSPGGFSGGGGGGSPPEYPPPPSPPPPSPPPPPPIPLPGTFWLLASGLAGLLAWRRRG